MFVRLMHKFIIDFMGAVVLQPGRCPVWHFYALYGHDDTHDFSQKTGCTGYTYLCRWVLRAIGHRTNHS